MVYLSGERVCDSLIWGPSTFSFISILDRPCPNVSRQYDIKNINKISFFSVSRVLSLSFFIPFAFKLSSLNERLTHAMAFGWLGIIIIAVVAASPLVSSVFRLWYFANCLWEIKNLLFIFASSSSEVRPGGNFGFPVRLDQLGKNRGEIRSIASVYVELASADRKGGAFFNP